jgi:hypothetical protein
MNEMKPPPPETDFIARLEQAFTDILNAESMRQVKEGIAAASKRLTRRDLEGYRRRCSHSQPSGNCAVCSLAAHFRPYRIDARAMRDRQCGLQFEGAGMGAGVIRRFAHFLAGWPRSPDIYSAGPPRGDGAYLL